jgi:hypothetical protein
MDQHQRVLLRASSLIRSRLAAKRQTDGNVYLPDRLWNELQTTFRMMERARQRGWYRAAAWLRTDLRFQAIDCTSQLNRLCNVLQEQVRDVPFPPAAEIYRDLLALEQEFESVSCDLRRGQLRVETEPIVLDGLDLGRFEICLEWNRMDRERVYRIIALDPRPAATNASVTHPHVQDEHLCEGDGHQAIQAALADGRLFDFFVIVARILGTYAYGSAFVELNQWGGLPCHQCGDSVDSDERTYCNGCDELLCDGCNEPCRECGSSYCSGCISGCKSCGHTYCSGCLGECHQCSALTCSECLEESLCPGCREPENQGEPHDQTTSEAGLNPTCQTAGQQQEGAVA